MNIDEQLQQSKQELSSLRDQQLILESIVNTVGTPAYILQDCLSKNSAIIQQMQPLLLNINYLEVKKLIETLETKRDQIATDIEANKADVNALISLSHQFEQLQMRIDELKARYPDPA